MGKVVGWVPAPKGARCSGGTGPTNDGRSQVAGRTQKYPLPISCVCSRRREYFASWRVVDFCANRFLLSFRSSNEGATPWLRKQRKRKRRRRSSFELQYASQLKARRLSSAAGHIQPPFACAICILNGEGGRLDPRHFLIDYECLRTRGPHCTSRPPPLSTLAPSYIPCENKQGIISPEQGNRDPITGTLTTLKTPPAPRTATLTFRENASKVTLIDKTANLRDVCEPHVSVA